MATGAHRSTGKTAGSIKKGRRPRINDRNDAPGNERELNRIFAWENNGGAKSIRRNCVSPHKVRTRSQPPA